MIGVRYFGIGHSGKESYDGAVIEWQPIIDSLSQSVIVLPRILIRQYLLVIFLTSFKSY